MDVSFSEENSHKPIGQLRKDLAAVYEDNDDLVASIKEKKNQIQQENG